jgi:hypothetical protein
MKEFGIMIAYKVCKELSILNKFLLIGREKSSQIFISQGNQ